MEFLKLTSIRLSKKALEQAQEMSRGRVYFSKSDVIRMAIWIGLKVIKVGSFHELSQMMWQEEYDGVNCSLEDVLRTAGVKLENLKNIE